MTNGKWHEIWEKRKADEKELKSGDAQRVFMELKRIAGWDSVNTEGGYDKVSLAYDEFYSQYIQTKNELEFNATTQKKEIKSIFEVGCGCGANLYLFQRDGIKVGGIDYSSAEIEIAKGVLETPKELICDEASNLSCEIMYDAILSNSVFSYFDGYDYAYEVLEKMYKKAEYSIGIIDIHDAGKKDAFIAYRKQVIENYEERYKDLPKFFYEKQFFLNFAETHDMSIRFSKPSMKEYWNNDYVYNCFMIKNEM